MTLRYVGPSGPDRVFHIEDDGDGKLLCGAEPILAENARWLRFPRIEPRLAATAYNLCRACEPDLPDTIDDPASQDSSPEPAAASDIKAENKAPETPQDNPAAARAKPDGVAARRSRKARRKSARPQETSAETRAIAKATASGKPAEPPRAAPDGSKKSKRSQDTRDGKKAARTPQNGAVAPKSRRARNGRGGQSQKARRAATVAEPPEPVAGGTSGRPASQTQLSLMI